MEEHRQGRRRLVSSVDLPQSTADVFVQDAWSAYFGPAEQAKRSHTFIHVDELKELHSQIRFDQWVAQEGVEELESNLILCPRAKFWTFQSVAARPLPCPLEPTPPQ